MKDELAITESGFLSDYKLPWSILSSNFGLRPDTTTILKIQWIPIKNQKISVAPDFTVKSSSEAFSCSRNQTQ